MALLTTAKKLLRYPNLAQAADLAFLLQILAEDVDAYTAGYTENIFALRPAAGKSGQFFWATDTSVLYVDDGVIWHVVGFVPDGSITLAKLAANSVDASKIVDGSVGTAELAASSVDSSKIVDGTIVTADIANLAVTSAKMAAGSGRAEDYSLTFPTTGLYNGYRHTLFVSGVIAGGYVAQEFIYRADLDGTYPWHFIGGGPQANSGSGTFNDGAYNFYDLTGGFSVPRSGWYEGFGYAFGGAGGGGGVTSRFIMGATTFGAAGGGNQCHNGFAAMVPGPMTAGDVIKMQGQSSDGFAGSYTGYFGCRPIRLI